MASVCPSPCQKHEKGIQTMEWTHNMCETIHYFFFPLISFVSNWMQRLLWKFRRVLDVVCKVCALDKPCNAGHVFGCWCQTPSNERMNREEKKGKNERTNGSPIFNSYFFVVRCWKIGVCAASRTATVIDSAISHSLKSPSTIYYFTFFDPNERTYTLHRHRQLLIYRDLYISVLCTLLIRFSTNSVHSVSSTPAPASHRRQTPIYSHLIYVH